MIVYRYQDSQGFGPYASSQYSIKLNSVINHKGHSHNRPAVRPDNYKCNGHYLCGFLSIGQAREWFTLQEHFILKECGFNLVKFAVPEKDVFKWPTQIYFYTKNAYELGVYDVERRKNSDLISRS